MLKVQRKAPKKRSKWLPVYILTGIIAACVCTALLLSHLNTTQTPQYYDRGACTLFTCEENNIESITITPKSGSSYMLLYEEGNLILASDDSVTLREAMQEAILLCAKQIDAYATVCDTAQETIELSDYGLNPPLASMTVQCVDKTECTLLLGSKTYSETSTYYAMIAGDSNLYTVTEDVYDALNYEQKSLYPVQELSVQADLIDRITITTPDSVFSAYYTQSGWMMDEPFVYPLDTSKTDSILEKLEDMLFARYVGELDELDAEEIGLSSPRLTLKIDFAASVLTVPDEDGNEYTFDIPPSSIEISLGAYINEASFYMLYEGSVYVGTTITYYFLEHFDAENMYLQNPVNFASNNLSALTIERNGQTMHYDITMIERVLENNELETDEYGNILYDVAPYLDGQKVDSTDFLRFYQALVNLTPEGRLNRDYTPDGEIVCALSITNADGSITRKITFRKMNSVYLAVGVDDVYLYYISLDALEAALDS